MSGLDEYSTDCSSTKHSFAECKGNSVVFSRSGDYNIHFNEIQERDIDPGQAKHEALDSVQGVNSGYVDRDKMLSAPSMNVGNPDYSEQTTTATLSGKRSRILTKCSSVFLC